MQKRQAHKFLERVLFSPKFLRHLYLEALVNPLISIHSVYVMNTTKTNKQIYISQIEKIIIMIIPKCNCTQFLLITS